MGQLLRSSAWMKVTGREVRKARMAPELSSVDVGEMDFDEGDACRGQRIA
jgi:hypothetical protein